MQHFVTAFYDVNTSGMLFVFVQLLITKFRAFLQKKESKQNKEHK